MRDDHRTTPNPLVPTGGTAPGEGDVLELDSCHSVWSFEPDRRRFRRTLKGTGVPHVRTGWRPYFGIIFDEGSDGFVVRLNPEGTRLLRSWRHQPGCDTCDNCAHRDGERTHELRLDAIRRHLG